MTDPAKQVTAEHGDRPVRRIAVVGCAVLELELAALGGREGEQAGATRIVRKVQLEQGLHNDPPRLRRELQTVIDQIETDRQLGADAIVLGYGLCSRGVDELTVRRCTLVVPRAHDCITLLLGDRQRYADYVARHPGTYWYSPGWNKHHTPPGKERHDRLYEQYVREYGEDNAQFLMEQEQHWFTTYDRATYVHLTVGASETDKSYTQQCAQWLKWDYDEQQGNPQLLRDLLQGRWDDERFVVVPPGHRLLMTGDERIMTTAPIAEESTG